MQEFSYMPKKKIKCLNCGKDITYNVNRIPICICGHTLTLDNNDEPYGEMKGGKIILHYGDEEKHLSLDNSVGIMLLLPNIKFKNEEYIKQRFISSHPSLKNVFEKWKASDIILHLTYMAHSEVYKVIFNHKYYNLAHHLLLDQNFRMFDSSVDDYDFSLLGEYLTDAPKDSRICLILDYYLMNCSKEEAHLLADANITPAMISELQLSTQFTDEAILKYIKELNFLMYQGEEIVHMIQEYEFLTDELWRYFHKTFDPENTIYNNLNLARNMHQMFERNGMLQYNKYLQNFEEEYEQYEINGYVVHCIGTKEIGNLPFNTLPQNDIKNPILGVYQNGELITYVLNIDDNLILKGNKSDKVKATINKYLDIVN